MLGDLEKAREEIAKNRAEVIERLVQFSMTDLLLFWGQEKDLMERQTKIWGPILAWAEEKMKAKFVTTQGLDVPQENQTSGYRLKVFLESLSDKELTAFYAAALQMRSVLLATQGRCHQPIDILNLFPFMCYFIGYVFYFSN